MFHPMKKGFLIGIAALSISLSAFATEEVTLEGYTPPQPKKAAPPVADLPVLPPSSAPVTPCDQLKPDMTLDQVKSILAPKFSLSNAGHIFQLGDSTFEFDGSGNFVKALEIKSDQAKKIADAKMSLTQVQQQFKEGNVTVIGLYYLFKSLQKPESPVEVQTTVDNKFVKWSGDCT